MKDINKVDLGSIKIHKKVLEEITLSAIKDIKGVSLMNKDFRAGLKDFLGIKNSPGIAVIVDKNNQVTIDVKVLVRSGMNIPEVARQVQDTVQQVIEKTVDVDLKDVNVNIQGIERGDQ